MIKDVFKDFNKNNIVASILVGISTIVMFVFLMWLTKTPYMFTNALLWVTFFASCVMSISAFHYINEISEKSKVDSDAVIIPYAIVSTILALFIIISALTGTKLFNARKYQSFMEIESANMDMINELNEDMVVVDVEIAEKVGDRTIGGIKNSTWYDVDNEYNLCIVNGEYVRISPLNYSGFFKWNKAKTEGIPGYVSVNAQTQEAKYVELKNPIKYSLSGYFGKNLKRHLKHECHGYFIGKSYFEIDEDGNAWWVTSLKKTTIGLFHGKKVVKIAVTNPTTGEVTLYDTNDIPKWIDHAYELDYLMEWTTNHYALVNGWINYAFSETGVNNLTYNYDKTHLYYNSVITKDGNVAFYTGVTPANNAESNLGFILCDTRTGEVKYIDCAGAEEISARDAAQSLVQNYGYEASFPVVVNVNGVPSYFMTLKDEAGLIQRYAICNIENYSIVVEAENINDAVASYVKKLNKDGIKAEENPDYVPAVSEVKGTVTNLSNVVIDGETNYVFYVEDNQIVTVPFSANKELAFLKVGDKIDILYEDDKIVEVNID